MKFSIITPTFKRKDLLTRAMNSLLQQTYQDWEMIIVNDSPFDTSYNEFASSINDARIHYHVNNHNQGVNYSRNFALSKISADSRWVIFLDDDDYFAPDTLQNFHNLILSNQDKKWFVTNRAKQSGEPFTKFPHDEQDYNYAWSYLILKRCKGDATHCIETKRSLNNKIHFSEQVKQGEEWFFFFQVGLHSAMHYTSHNSTISDGYNEITGLNFRKRPKSEQLETISKLLYSGTKIGLTKKISFMLYIILRITVTPFK